MATGDTISDGKLQYSNNREAAKTSELSPGKIDKYEYLTGSQILPSKQRQIVNILNKEKLLKNKQKQLKSDLKNRCYYKSKQKTSGFNQSRLS